jgi:hypothetical protein
LASSTKKRRKEEKSTNSLLIIVVGVNPGASLAVSDGSEALEPSGTLSLSISYQCLLPLLTLVLLLIIIRLCV